MNHDITKKPPMERFFQLKEIKKIKSLYLKELFYIQQNNIPPRGVYRHLKSFDSFKKWYIHMNDFFDPSIVDKKENIL